MSSGSYGCVPDGDHGLRSARWPRWVGAALLAVGLGACLSDLDRDKSSEPINEDPRGDAAAPSSDASSSDGGSEDELDAGSFASDDAGELDAGFLEQPEAEMDASEASAPDEHEEDAASGPVDASIVPDASRDAGKPYTGIPDAGPIVVAPWVFMPAQGADASFTAVYAFLRGNCRGCHGSSPNGLDLSSREATYLSLVGGPSMGESEMYCGKGFYKVIPGDPAHSLLFLKMHGKQVCGYNMPPGVTNSHAILSTVWRWIDNGALDD